MPVAFLGLGSNQGDRLGNLQEALDRLEADEGLEVLLLSSFYETEPVGFPDQPWFANLVAMVQTQGTPRQLLEACLRVEASMGRVRDPHQKNGPRVLDLDILFYEHQMIEEAGLVIPHPRLHERAFVLVPMLEIQAQWVHPKLNKTIEQLAEALTRPEAVYLFGARNALV